MPAAWSARSSLTTPATPMPIAGRTFLDQRTYFVQPSLTETVIDEWYGWAIGPSTPTVNWYDPIYLDNIHVDRAGSGGGPHSAQPGRSGLFRFPHAEPGRLGHQSRGRDLLRRRLDRKKRRHPGRRPFGRNRSRRAGCRHYRPDIFPGPIQRSLTVVGRQGLSLSQVQNSSPARVAGRKYHSCIAAKEILEEKSMALPTAKLPQHHRRQRASLPVLQRRRLD